MYAGQAKQLGKIDVLWRSASEAKAHAESISAAGVVLCILGLTFCTSTSAGAVSDLFEHNFYQIADETDQGATVQAGLNYANDGGLFASGNAVFHEQGFVNNLSTGYAGAIDGFRLSFDYSAVQYNINSFSVFQGLANLSTGYKQFSYRYSFGSDYRSAKYSIQQYLGPVKTRLSREDIQVTNHFEKIKYIASGYIGSLEISNIREQQQNKNTNEYRMIYWVARNSSLRAYSIQEEQQQPQAEISMAHRIRKNTVVYRLNQINGVSISQPWIQSISLDKKFKNVNFSFSISDSAPGLDSMAFTVTYEKRLHF